MTRKEVNDRVEEVLARVVTFDDIEDPSWPIKMDAARDEMLEIVYAYAAEKGRAVTRERLRDSNFSRDKESFIAP